MTLTGTRPRQCAAVTSRFPAGLRTTAAVQNGGLVILLWSRMTSAPTAPAPAYGTAASVDRAACTANRLPASTSIRKMASPVFRPIMFPPAGTARPVHTPMVLSPTALPSPDDQGTAWPATPFLNSGVSLLAGRRLPGAGVTSGRAPRRGYAGHTGP